MALLSRDPSPVFRPLFACALGLSLVVWGGCAASDDSAGGGADSTSGTGGGTAATPTTATASATATNTAGMSGAGSDSADSTGAGEEDTSTEGGSFIDMPDDSGDGGPQPLGGMCDGPDGCESGFCYTVPMLGGACSECLTDSDCESGTCALDFNAGYASCTDGSAGVMCDSDRGCTGDLVCAELIDTGGIFPATYCSECDDDLPCGGEAVCSPVYDLGGFGGSLQCVDPGTVENGGGCPIGDGSVCASTFCGTADLFGALSLGVCGECIVDDDCAKKGQVCVPASADMMGLMPATCQ